MFRSNSNKWDQCISPYAPSVFHSRKFISQATWLVIFIGLFTITLLIPNSISRDGLFMLFFLLAIVVLTCVQFKSFLSSAHQLFVNRATYKYIHLCIYVYMHIYVYIRAYSCKVFQTHPTVDIHLFSVPMASILQSLGSLMRVARGVFVLKWKFLFRFTQYYWNREQNFKLSKFHLAFGRYDLYPYTANRISVVIDQKQKPPEMWTRSQEISLVLFRLSSRICTW